MSDHPHFTTRRGFIATMGFGALGLYGTWAAYGASPFPFASLFTDPVAHDAHAALLAHQKPLAAEAHGHEISALTPEQFAERQAEFLKLFRRDDGSVYPQARPVIDDGHVMTDMPAAPEPAHAHDHGAMADPEAMAGHDMPANPSAMDHGAGHGASSDAGSHANPHADPHADLGNDHAAMAMPGPGAKADHAGAGHGGAGHAEAGQGVADAIDVYLAANRYAFDPDRLVLKKGQRYRFLMLASDVTHGAAIALGRGSRIVRLRPGIVTNLELTFLRSGDHLLYCTVHCGAGHDLMHAKITVA